MKHPHIFTSHDPILCLQLAFLPASAPVQYEAKGQKSYDRKCSLVFKNFTFYNSGLPVFNLHAI